MGERRLGEQVVGDPVRELGERVGGAGRDDEQVGAGQVGVEVLAAAARRASAAKVAAETKRSAAGRRERHHLVTLALTSSRTSSQAL